MIYKASPIWEKKYGERCTGNCYNCQKDIHCMSSVIKEGQIICYQCYYDYIPVLKTSIDTLWRNEHGLNTVGYCFSCEKELHFKDKVLKNQRIVCKQCNHDCSSYPDDMNIIDYKYNYPNNMDIL